MIDQPEVPGDRPSEDEVETSAKAPEAADAQIDKNGSASANHVTEDNPPSPWRRFAAVSLAALALMGDITGVISGPWPTKLTLGAASLILGVVVLFVKKWLTGLAAPVATAAAFIMLGGIVLPIGVRGATVAANQKQRAALAATCSAAQDYREAYLAEATQLAATGLPTAGTRQASERALADLEKLTDAADRSGSQDVVQLAQNIRLQATAAAAMNGSLRVVTMSNELVASWKSFHKLIALCKSAGLAVSVSGPYGITPSIKAACRYLDQFFYISTRPGAVKAARHDTTQWWTLTNLILYNSLNVNDAKFWAEGRSFGKFIDGTVSPYDGIAPMYNDCVARGIKMHFRNGVPPP
jgi:hypothetical protein